MINSFFKEITIFIKDETGSYNEESFRAGVLWALGLVSGILLAQGYNVDIIDNVLKQLKKEESSKKRKKIKTTEKK